VEGNDEEMQRFVPIEDLFKGRHFDRQIIVLCVSWYTSFQAERAGSGDHDGRSRHFRDAYNDSLVGPALPAGVREALAALRSTRRRIVEDGRDLYKGSRTMGVPVPRRRQSGPNSRFLSQPEPGRERRQIISAQRDEEHSRAHEDQVGRLCGLAPGSAGDEGRTANFRVASRFDPLAEKIKKGQFKTGKLDGCNATMTELWNAAIAA
jgi:hypothetical protein